MNIQEEYTNRKNNSSDINEHLETLYKYGKKCKSITELGSRHGDSTVALLNSQPETMVSYDLFKSEFIDEIKLENYKFITDDSLKISIEKTDLPL